MGAERAAVREPRRPTPRGHQVRWWYFLTVVYSSLTCNCLAWPRSWPAAGKAAARAGDGDHFTPGRRRATKRGRRRELGPALATRHHLRGTYGGWCPTALLLTRLKISAELGPYLPGGHHKQRSRLFRGGSDASGGPPSGVACSKPVDGPRGAPRARADPPVCPSGVHRTHGWQCTVVVEANGRGPCSGDS